uniref:Uncharacterized protein n=1 Tax=Arundo donax TaxID=35708 RepID=A0A0A9CRY3_ARUDO
MPYFPGMALSCCYEVLLSLQGFSMVLSIMGNHICSEVSSQHLNCVYVHY